MANRKLLIDFGSTFTKALFVDLETSEIVARAKHYSTVDTDVTQGLNACLEDISSKLGRNVLHEGQTLACSSAAGGLRIVCVGFVPDYSSLAANQAALGAGAKVIGVYSYEITRQETDEIVQAAPDILLLTGGTDGGNKKVIIHNAAMLASCDLPNTTLIVAGNKSAVDDIRAVFEPTALRVFYSANVMPEVGRLDVTACNSKIRDIFIDTIVDAKGIGKARRLIGDVLMPTPLAVLKATRLLADGTDGEQGLGEVIVVDVGGATTDVHSVAQGAPAAGVAAQVGLPEPYEKRTVEGDLGLKFNLERLIELLLKSNPKAEIGPFIERFKTHGFIPADDDEIAWHTRLSRLAVEVAVTRHVGHYEVTYGPSGQILLQYGKDFTKVRSVIGTGGPIVFSRQPDEILAGAAAREEDTHILKPKAPEYYLDSEYLLFAGGLLGRTDPEAALRFMKRHLKKL